MFLSCPTKITLKKVQSKCFKLQRHSIGTLNSIVKKSHSHHGIPWAPGHISVSSGLCSWFGRPAARQPDSFPVCRSPTAASQVFVWLAVGFHYVSLLCGLSGSCAWLPLPHAGTLQRSRMLDRRAHANTSDALWASDYLCTGSRACRAALKCPVKSY